MIWACTYKDKHGSYWFAFNTELDALTWACSCIQETINNNWDMNNLNMANVALYINNLFIAQRYRDVIAYWNVTCRYNLQGNNPDTYRVSNYPALPGKVITPWDPSFFKALNVVPAGPTVKAVPPTIPATSHKAKTASSGSGATCRKCQTPNEYASPDSSDGTYECYGCRSMA